MSYLLIGISFSAISLSSSSNSESKYGKETVAKLKENTLLVFRSCGRLQKDHDSSHPERTPLCCVTSLLLSSEVRVCPATPWLWDWLCDLLWLVDRCHE